MSHEEKDATDRYIESEERRYLALFMFTCGCAVGSLATILLQTYLRATP